MRILVLGLNYAPEEIGISVYTTGLCEGLVGRGHEVWVVAAKPYYPQWKIRSGFGGGWKRSSERGVEITRCPLYVPRVPNGAKRLLHHASFALSSFLPTIIAARTLRPDLVMTVAPSLVAAPVAWLAAKVVSARSWLHIQDFEVEAAFATGLLDSSTAIARLARKCERGTIGLFDRISSISPEMCAKLKSFGLDDNRIVEFRNWADIDAIRPLEAISSYRTEWSIDTPHVALYSGNIANKQGIGIIVEAAQRLQHRSDLRFVVCGEGPNRANLEHEARGLENIEFHDLQPSERLVDLLGLATIHLLPQKANAADLVLPSKLTNMLASGRPIVVTAAPGTGLARETEGCGVVTPPEDAAAFADAIERLIDDPVFHRDASLSARARAERVWNSTLTIDGFEQQATELTASGRQRL
jgi:colanic acid biosynthesis glycosyl transferase WcaI